MPKKPRPQLVLLGKHIRGLREKKGLSQDAFAFEAKLGRGYYSSLERGELNPAALNLIRMAEVLGCEVGDLFPPLRDLSKLKVKVR